MLIVCARCHRHARGARCPFCGESLGATLPKAPRRGSRAAMFGAVALFAAPFGCGARTDLGGVVEDEDVRDAGVEACQPSVTVYGGPFLDVCVPPHDAMTHDVSAADVTEQDVTVVPPYGAHFPDDDE